MVDLTSLTNRFSSHVEGGLHFLGYLNITWEKKTWKSWRKRNGRKLHL